MFCKRCGAGLRENDKFCSQCGAPAAGTSEDYPVNLNIPCETPNGMMGCPEDTPYEAANGKQSYPESRIYGAYDSSETSGTYGTGTHGSFEQPENYGEYGNSGYTGFYGSSRADAAEKSYYDEKLYRDGESKYRDSFLDKKEEKSHAILVTVAVLLIILVLTMAFLVIFFFVKKNDAGTGQAGDIQIISDENQNQGQNAAGGDGDGLVLLTEAGGQGQGAEAGNGQAQGAGGNAAGSPDTGGGAGAAAGQETEPQAAPAELQTEAPTEPQTETSAPEAPAIDMNRINEILSRDSTATKAQVYVYDLNHQKEYATEGAGEAMYASALISVPILYTAAVKLDQKEITLNDAITYVNSIGGRGEAYPEQKEGQSFPLSYYLTTMMSYSDNNCMNCLIDFFGLDTINSTCQAAGFSSVDLQRKIVAEVTDGKDNYVSAKDLAGMLKDLYWGKYQTLGSEFIKKYFKIDAGDGYRTVIGLADQLPSGILFLNQNGRGDTRYNEVALIADDTHQYIISVMCNGDYGFQYETAVENISNYVYQSLT